MDFARKQLEKYGWTEGKGLGKNENGISQALKPKLKRSVAGVGHDLASEFNEHWWITLYDKAAGNVEVKETNGTTKKIKTKDDFTITNSMWQIKRNSKKQGKEQYSGYFVRTAVMDVGSKIENVRDTDSEEETETKDVFKMTDEELFAACEGRTAHKGARHGLKALGKLARIARQEELLLSQSRYNGYSHTKKRKENMEDVVEEVTFETGDESNRKKKKKKRKHCLNENRSNEVEGGKLIEVQASTESRNEDYAVSVFQADIDHRKKKSKKDNEVDIDSNAVEDKKEQKDKKKRKNNEDIEIIAMEIDNINDSIDHEKVKKKMKKKMNKSC